jgi:hypothetical protein
MRVRFGSSWALLCLLQSFTCSPAFAEPAVAGLELVSSTRVGRTTYDYTYKVQLTNTIPAYKDITIQVASSRPQSTTVIDSFASYAHLGAGASGTSSDTIVIRHDRAVAFDPKVLQWVVRGTPAAPFSPFTMFSEINSPALMAYDGPDGYRITVTGKKNEDGTAASLTGMNIAGPNGEFSSLQIDELGRPSAALLEDGTKLTFTWISASEVNIRIITADETFDGELRVQLPAATVLRASSAAKSSGLRTTAASNALLANTIFGEALIEVSSPGGKVSGAGVWLEFIDPNEVIRRGTIVNASEIAPGFYEAHFENFPERELTAQEIFAACRTCLETYQSVLNFLAGPVQQVRDKLAEESCEALGDLTGVPQVTFHCVKLLLMSDPARNIEVSKVCQTLTATVDFFLPDGMDLYASARKRGVEDKDGMRIASGVTRADFTLNLPLRDYATSSIQATGTTHLTQTINGVVVNECTYATTEEGTLEFILNGSPGNVARNTTLFRHDLVQGGCLPILQGEDPFPDVEFALGQSGSQLSGSRAVNGPNLTEFITVKATRTPDQITGTVTYERTFNSTVGTSLIHMRGTTTGSFTANVR